MHDSTMEFDDGTIVERDTKNLKLIVNSPEDGKLEISGFNNESEMSDFAYFCDFENSKDNDFYICTSSNTKLQWTVID